VKSPEIQELIPLVFPLKIKGEMSWLLSPLFIRDGREGISFLAFFSQDLYPITLARKHVIIGDSYSMIFLCNFYFLRTHESRINILYVPKALNLINTTIKIKGNTIFHMRKKRYCLIVY
jgi:hypothetical protein